MVFLLQAEVIHLTKKIILNGKLAMMLLFLLIKTIIKLKILLIFLTQQLKIFVLLVIIKKIKLFMNYQNIYIILLNGKLFQAKTYRTYKIFYLE